MYNITLVAAPHQIEVSSVSNQKTGRGRQLSVVYIFKMLFADNIF